MALTVKSRTGEVLRSSRHRRGTSLSRQASQSTDVMIAYRASPGFAVTRPPRMLRTFRRRIRGEMSQSDGAVDSPD